MTVATTISAARFAMLATAAAGLLLTACDADVRVDADGAGRGELRTLARLTCPEREDQLDRVSASADGLTCDYAGEGAQIRLQLVALNGRTPADALASYETELRALMPAMTATSDRAPMADLNTDTGVVVGVESNEDEAHVRMPGMSIDADGERAQVRIGNVLTIDADDTDSVVKIRSDEGDVTVNADESGAEVRTSRSEAGELRSTFILASEATTADGLRLVGYEARGPAAGPIVVATIRARGEDGDDKVDAMKDLVRKNVGQ